MDQQHSIPIEKLRKWSQNTPDNPALYRCIDKGWQTISWSEYYRQSRAVGAALVAAGQEPSECVVILSANRAKWLFTQWGIMMAGGVTTPCYMTNPKEHVSYLVGHCKARFVFVENAEQLAKLAAVRGELDKLELAIAYDTEGIDSIDGVSPDWVVSYDEFLSRAEDGHQKTLDDRIDSID